MQSVTARIRLALLVLATLALGFTPVGARAAVRAIDCATDVASTAPGSACADDGAPDMVESCCGGDEPCCCVEAPAAPSRPPSPTAPARSSEQGPSLAITAPEANRAAPPLAPDARASTSPSAPVDAALTGFAASPAERRLHLRQALLLD